MLSTRQFFGVAAGLFVLFASIFALLAISQVVSGDYLLAFLSAGTTAGLTVLARLAYNAETVLGLDTEPMPEVVLPPTKVEDTTPMDPERFAALLRPEMYATLRVHFPEAAKRLSHSKKEELVKAYNDAYIASLKQELTDAINEVRATTGALPVTESPHTTSETAEA